MSGVNLENYSMINKCSVFHQEIYILLQQQMFCDVTIVDDHGRKVKAHSCMLAASSSVLKEMLRDQPLPVTLHQPGMSLVTWKLLIEFIYKRHIDLQSNTEDPETIKTLYCAATEWAVEELKLILADHMTQFFPHFSHTLKCRFNHGLKVTCDCTQREVGTIRDQFPYDKKDCIQTPHIKPAAFTCRYCAALCGSRFAVIEHVYGSCVKIHSRPGQHLGCGQLPTDRKRRYKRRCKMRKNSMSNKEDLEDEIFVGEAGDNVDSSDENTEQTGTLTSSLMNESHISCRATAEVIENPPTTKQQMIQECTKIKPNTEDTAVGNSHSTTVSDTNSLQVQNRVSNQGNRMEIHKKVPESLRSTQLLLENLRRQNEDLGKIEHFEGMKVGAIKQEERFKSNRTKQAGDFYTWPNVKVAGFGINSQRSSTSTFTANEINLIQNYKTGSVKLSEELKTCFTEQKESYKAIPKTQRVIFENIPSKQSTSFNVNPIKETGDRKARLSNSKESLSNSHIKQKKDFSVRAASLIRESSVSTSLEKMRKQRDQVKHNKLYVCLDMQCGAVFNKLHDFTAHLRHCLTGGDYVDPEKFLHRKGDLFTLLDEPTVIPAGAVKHPSFSLLENHCQTHKRKKTKQYSCSHCPHTEIGMRRILSHVINVHRKIKPYQCWRCKQRFFGFQELKNHVQRHHGSVRVFTCGQCSAKFSCKAALRSHRLQEHKHTDHSGKSYPRYKCSSCSKVFKLPHQRRRHEIIHVRQEDRPHMCRVCGKKFTTSSSLKCHMYLHTGVKPFRCPKCPFKVSRKSHLQLHMKTHGLQIVAYSCATCDKKFVLKNKLEEHLRKFGHVAEKLVHPMYEPITKTSTVTPSSAANTPSSMRADGILSQTVLSKAGYVIIPSTAVQSTNTHFTARNTLDCDRRVDQVGHISEEKERGKLACSTPARKAISSTSADTSTNVTTTVPALMSDNNPPRTNVIKIDSLQTLHYKQKELATTPASSFPQLTHSVHLSTLAGSKHTAPQRYPQGLPMFTLLSDTLTTGIEGPVAEAIVSTELCVDRGRDRDTLQVDALQVDQPYPAKTGMTNEALEVAQIRPTSSITFQTLGKTSGDFTRLNSPQIQLDRPNTLQALMSSPNKGIDSTAPKPLDRHTGLNQSVQSSYLQCNPVFESTVGRLSEQSGILCSRPGFSKRGQNSGDITKRQMPHVKPDDNTLITPGDFGSGRSVVIAEKPFSVSTGILKYNCPQSYSPPRSETFKQGATPFTHLLPEPAGRRTYRSYLDQPPPEVRPKVVLQYPGETGQGKTDIKTTPSGRSTVIGQQQDTRNLSRVGESVIGERLYVQNSSES